MAQQMPLPFTISCSSKSRLVLPSLFLPFWYLLTRVVPNKFQKSSKTVVCVCVCVCQYSSTRVMVTCRGSAKKVFDALIGSGLRSVVVASVAQRPSPEEKLGSALPSQEELRPPLVDRRVLVLQFLSRDQGWPGRASTGTRG